MFSHLYWKLWLSTIPYYLWSSFISWLKWFGSPVLKAKFPFESAAMCGKLCLCRSRNSVLPRGVTRYVCAHPHVFAALYLVLSFFPVCFNSPQCLIFCILSAALISLMALSFLSMTTPQNPHSLINLLLSRIRNRGRVFLCHETHTQWHIAPADKTLGRKSTKDLQCLYITWAGA